MKLEVGKRDLKFVWIEQIRICMFAQVSFWLKDDWEEWKENNSKKILIRIIIHAFVIHDLWSKLLKGIQAEVRKNIP